MLQCSNLNFAKLFSFFNHPTNIPFNAKNEMEFCTLWSVFEFNWLNTFQNGSSFSEILIFLRIQIHRVLRYKSIFRILLFVWFIRRLGIIYDTFYSFLLLGSHKGEVLGFLRYKYISASNMKRKRIRLNIAYGTLKYIYESATKPFRMFNSEMEFISYFTHSFENKNVLNETLIL